MAANNHLTCTTHAIELENVTVRLNGVEIVKGVSGAIRCGEITAIIGPNGAGKTTLLQAILGLIPYSGKITFCPAPEHGSGMPAISYIPQHIDFDRGAPITVMDFLTAGVQRTPLWFGHGKANRRRAASALERAGVAHLHNHRLGTLSGGEFQRVILALAIKDEPDILLMDEPISGVDVGGEEIFWDILYDLQKQHQFTLVIVSHDLSFVTEQAGQVICLNRTVKCSGRAAEVLTSGMLQELFGLNTDVLRHHGDHYHVPDSGHAEPKVSLEGQAGVSDS